MGYQRKHTVDDWKAARAAIRSGMSIRGAAAHTGIDPCAIWRWGRAEEPPEWMWYNLRGSVDVDRPRPPRRSPRARLDFEDRACIAAMLETGMTRSQVARRLGVARSTVVREVSRHGTGDGYDPRAAHVAARRAARRPRARKLDEDAGLRGFVVDGLLDRWSPRQISRRLVVEFPDDEEMRVSHETIYQAIYVQGRGSLRQELAVEQALRSGRTRRRPTSKLPPRPRGRSWVEGCEISRRPAEADDRAVPGHWEGDLVVGGDMSSCLVTLVERKTRFLVARRLDSHDTETVVDLLVGMCADVPDSIRDGLLSTLTWDQGCEMADAARFTQATGFEVYFCDPHSPWQKGTNENTNGLIRQYFPKGTRFVDVGDDEVQLMQDQLNGRPRETLQWRTPAEALAEELEKAAVAMTD